MQKHFTMNMNFNFLVWYFYFNAHHGTTITKLTNKHNWRKKNSNREFSPFRIFHNNKHVTANLQFTIHHRKLLSFQNKQKNL